MRGGKKKTKVTVKEGGEIFCSFFKRVRFSMLKVQSNLQLYSSRSSENRKTKIRNTIFRLKFFLKDNFCYTLGQKLNYDF